MCFVGLALHDPAPDAKTIWLFREQLTKAGAVPEALRPLRCDPSRGWGAGDGGQIVDATVIQARPARLTAEEKS